MTQFPLPYQTHSATSFLAAFSKIGEKDTELRKVFGLLVVSRDGLTDEQMQERLGMFGNTQRPRRVELVKLGLVREMEGKRKTRSGRAASVWGVV